MPPVPTNDQVATTPDAVTQGGAGGDAQAAPAARTAPTLPHARASLEPPRLLLPVPGTEPRKRLRPRIDWELFACGLHGHDLVGTDAAEVRDEDAPFAREADGIRWHRCLRCEAWVPLEPPVAPAVAHPPSVDEIQLPIRGRRLRDRYVLRLIVLERVIHVLIVGALDAAIFLFAQHRAWLHKTYVKILTALQGGVGGSSSNTHSGIVYDLNHLFRLSTATIYLIGVAVAVYTTVLILESFGLWRSRRWAEYLTVVETSCFIPFEIYELAGSVSGLKVFTLVVNLAIVGYLLIAHRLFGLRGGVKAAVAAYGGEG
ncbi:MAG: DUF2127 domain-containing protein [Acidimicrobiales bacterium]